MTTQLALDLAIVAPAYVPGMTLAERYEAWRAVNGHVVDAFEHYAAVWLSRHERVGAKQIAEQLRWASGVSESGTAWKLDNNMTSRVARELLERHPEWAGRITVRALSSERAA